MRVEMIALFGERLQTVDGLEPLLDDELGHEPSRMLGVGANHLESGIALLLEVTVDHGARQTGQLHGLGVFLTGEVDDGSARGILGQGVRQSVPQ